jgi:hypothetical protein
MLLLPIIHGGGIIEFEKQQQINGTLFNYGIQEVTIPGLLISYYNSEKN